MSRSVSMPLSRSSSPQIGSAPTSSSASRLAASRTESFSPMHVQSGLITSRAFLSDMGPPFWSLCPSATQAPRAANEERQAGCAWSSPNDGAAAMTDSFVTVPREAPGVRRGLWTRRVVLCVFAAVAVLGLLDVFGQKATGSSASSPRATMALSAPRAVRGGLLFQARVEIRATGTIKDPRLVLDEGWFE